MMPLLRIYFHGIIQILTCILVTKLNLMIKADDTIPTIMPNEMSSTEARQNWARLVQIIYEVNSLICPKCQGQMKII